MTEHLCVMTLASILNEARLVGMGSGSSNGRMKDCKPNAVGNMGGLAGRTWPLGRGTEGIVWGQELAGVALLCDGAMSPRIVTGSANLGTETRRTLERRSLPEFRRVCRQSWHHVCLSTVIDVS